MVNFWPFKQSNKPSEAEIEAADAAARLAERQKWVGKTLVGRVTDKVELTRINYGFGPVNSWNVTESHQLTGKVEKVGCRSVIIDGVGYETARLNVGGIEVIEVLE